MYDYAGEWIYRVGIPAKSGVGGGIVAALPSQIGLGTFSPCLDSHGNSVRGLKVCEALSARFDLHMLNRSADVRTCIIADYDIFGISSRRSRQPHEQQILDEHHSDIRVIELVGALNFATIDYVTRRLAERAAERAAADPRFPPRARPDRGGRAAAWREAHHPRQCRRHGDLTGFEATSRCGRRFGRASPSRRGCGASRCSTTPSNGPRIRSSIGYGGFTAVKETSHLGEQALLAELTPKRSPRWPNCRPRAAIRPASASSAPASRPTRCSSCRAAWSASSCRAACGWRRSGPAWSSARWPFIEHRAQRRRLGRYPGQMS